MSQRSESNQKIRGGVANKRTGSKYIRVHGNRPVETPKPLNHPSDSASGSAAGTGSGSLQTAPGRPRLKMKTLGLTRVLGFRTLGFETLGLIGFRV